MLQHLESTPPARCCVKGNDKWRVNIELLLGLLECFLALG